MLIGLQDDGSRWREGKTGTYNQVLGGDGFGVAWSQSRDRVSLATVYYSYIVRDMMNPPTTQAKWRVGWTGIEEFFNPALTYFNTALATPRASADPVGLTFFHRTRYRLYRTTNGAESWTCVMETPLATTPAAGASSQCAPPPAPPATPPLRVLLRAGSHPIRISPEDLDHFGVLANGGWFYSTVDGGATWASRNLTTIAAGWPGFNSTLAYASNMKLYVGNEAPIGTAARALKSLDGGATWTSINNGLPPVPISKLIVSPRDPSGNTVYAGRGWRLRDDRRRHVVAPVWQRTTRGRGQRSVHADRWQLPARVDIRPRRLGNAVLAGNGRILARLPARARWNFSSSWFARTITARLASTGSSCEPGIAK